MSYSRTNWVSGETPLSADNMNNIEDGIEENQQAIADLNSNLTVTSSNLSYTSSFVNYINESYSVYYVKYGKIVIISGYFHLGNTNVPSMSTFATSGFQFKQETFSSIISGERLATRFKLTTGGTLVIESELITTNSWHVFQVVGVLA